MATDGRKINRSVVFVVGLFLGGILMAFYVGPTYVALADSGVDGIDGISISGINILHDPMEDIPFESNSVSIIADVSAYTGVIDAVELYYDIGDGWITQEMNETFGNTYEGVISGLYNGMISKSISIICSNPIKFLPCSGQY